MLFLVAFRENCIDAFVPIPPNSQTSPRLKTHIGTEIGHKGGRLLLGLLSGETSALSETDAIRILRAQPTRSTKKHENGTNAKQSSHQSESLLSCTNSQDVLRVLQEMSPSRQQSGLSKKLEAEAIVDVISPNVAAAALRRLLSPPFLPVSFSTTKKGIQYQYLNNKQLILHEVSDLEKELYIQLLTLLHTKLKDELKSQSCCTNIDVDNTPTLLPNRTAFSFDDPPATAKAQASQLNWYAFADLLFSTSVLSNIYAYQSTKQNAPSKNIYLQSIVDEGFLSSDSSIDTFDKTIQYLSLNNEITSSFVRCVGPRRLVRDVLLPIIVVKIARKKSDFLRIQSIDDSEIEDLELWSDEIDEDDEYPSFILKHDHILQIVSSYLALPHSLGVLNCADLSMALWCFAQIYSASTSEGQLWSDEEQHQTLLGEARIKMITSFMKRLRKKSIHSMGSGKNIAQSIWSVARLVSLIEQQRLSNQWNSKMNGIDLPDDLIFPGESSVVGVQSEVNHTWNEFVVDLDFEKGANQVRDEAVIMFYTLSKELLKDSSSSSYCKLMSLSLEQLVDVLQSAIALKVPMDDLSMLTRSTIKILASDPSTNIINQCNSCGQISRLLWSLQRLRIGSSQTCEDPHPEAYCIQLLGERFLSLVRDQPQCTPKILVTSLRSAVMMFPGRSLSTTAIIQAASHLISATAKADMYHSSPFLLECNEYELSNLLFCCAKANWFDEGRFR
jgi:hypothetical protein